ncbi:MAG: CHAT domain-containing protein [Cyclobacteriaceae bacterium]|nr:CHAT domain-containing protein [Cyclobacteriaceae bacterium]
MKTLSCFGNQVDNQLEEIQKKLTEGRINEAHGLFEANTKTYIRAEDFLNLSYFIPYAGYIDDRRSLNGIKAAEDLLNFIASQSTDPRVLRQAWLEIHTYYVEAGKYQAAYEACEKALAYTLEITDHKPSEWAMIESNLGVIANYLGKPDLAKHHTFRAMEGYNLDPNPPKENIFNLYNDIGVRYWYESKWDSAEFFWLKGIDLLEEMEPTPTNKYFRKAMINNNLAAVYDVTGNPQESIRRVKMSIDLNQQFLDQAKGDPRYNRAMTSLFYGSANLAAVLKSLGNYRQALQIHEYTLAEKQKRFQPHHPEIIETLIHVGQAHKSMKNYTQAKKYLLQALAILELQEGEYFVQAGDAHHSLGLVFEAEENLTEAKKHFLIARENYQKAHKENYDYMYLDFLMSASRFFAGTQEEVLAYAFANEGLEYISNIDKQYSIPGLNQWVNMGVVAYKMGDYKASESYAEKSDDIILALLQKAKGSMDSIRMEYERPAATILKVKASYQLEKNRSIPFLKSAIAQLEQARTIMEKRKKTLNDDADLLLWVQQGEEINEYLIKLRLELLELTGENRIIDEILLVKESGVYSRIRSRLQQTKANRFSGVSEQILDKENRLRARLIDVFEEEDAVSAYLSLSDEWDELMREIQSAYPRYYQARFAPLQAEDIKLPDNLQAVRYFFISDQLKAVVFARGEQHLFNLNFEKELIGELMKHWDQPMALGRISNELYQQLWQPFEHLFEQERVLIVPDGVLFNLSFEMLVTSPVETFDAFAEKSLLLKHDISYSISLWLSSWLQQKKIKDNFIAFTPGFIDSMKEKYLIMLKDSSSVDREYLTLLPQPFTISLAQRAVSLFGGKNYAYEQSTPEAFRNIAGNNKIIHIGTHAESNNVSPAYSRLIFAKPLSPGSTQEENFVYAHEIYNIDMSSYLTVLTACETGKPVYQPGEGMISLSHAFQYSGSESLLTSLWKIDEKASMEITGYFYEYLQSGLAKDRALKLAKLQYLKTATGRTKSPQYWAGLVLIGSPDPIPGLNNRYTIIFWVVGILIFLVLIFIIIKKLNVKFL